MRAEGGGVQQPIHALQEVYPAILKKLGVGALLCLMRQANL
jgi:hypothetical protein